MLLQHLKMARDRLCVPNIPHQLETATIYTVFGMYFVINHSTVCFPQSV